MKTKAYRVMWEIDIEADSPREAATKAREIQRRTDSMATVFDVTDEDVTTRVDLLTSPEDDYEL